MGNGRVREGGEQIIMCCREVERSLEMGGEGVEMECGSNVCGFVIMLTPILWVN